jgi:hypothetical protein
MVRRILLGVPAVSAISRMVLSLGLLIVAAWQWPSQAHAVFGPLALMPAIHAGGGAVGDSGLHYDEAGLPYFGGYDYANSSTTWGTTVWLRGMAEGDQMYPSRYKFYAVDSCTVRGFLQRAIGGAWYDYYNYTADWIHVLPSISGYNVTQTVQYAGSWMYMTIGGVSSCSVTTGPHAHMAGDTRYFQLALAYHSDETCWADGSQCNIGNVRKHYACPWQYTAAAPGRSGTVFTGNQDYICEKWSFSTSGRTDSTPGLRIP